MLFNQSNSTFGYKNIKVRDRAKDDFDIVITSNIFVPRKKSCNYYKN